MRRSVSHSPDQTERPTTQSTTSETNKSVANVSSNAIMTSLQGVPPRSACATYRACLRLGLVMLCQCFDDLGQTRGPIFRPGLRRLCYACFFPSNEASPETRLLLIGG